MTTYKNLLLAALSTLVCACQPVVNAPKPIDPVPSKAQVEWQKMETYAFVHLGLNTFNDREWGYGDSKLDTFNPSNLDCEQWVKTFVNAGMKGVILTAKHHDGFCLWPTQLTEYSIRNTPYKDGKGDIVGELAAACKKYNIKFGIYLSPWDRNNKDYGTPKYVDYYNKQLTELLTQYGDIFEVWFDGANGGDGYYGGMKETRKIDRRTYYNFPELFKKVHELQPNAIIFSDGGPGCRWVGTEGGYVGATNWSFLRSGEVYPGYDKYRELQYGHADGDQWTPAECNVSIRPGWFYHPEEDNRVKSVKQLTDLYYRSIGHNGTFLLNFPIDRKGLVYPVDSAHAVNWYKNIQQQLADNLLKSIVPKVTDERGGAYTAQAMTDDDYDTYWATNDGVLSANVTFDLGEKKQVNRLLIQEYIPLGQRVKSFVVEYKQDNQWLPVETTEETTTVGYKRLVRFKTIEVQQIRIRFIDARACLTINNVEAYYADTRDDASFGDDLKAMKSYPFTLSNVTKEECAKATDKIETTTCFVTGNQLILDLGKECTISSFHFLPDQSEYNQGLISNYELSIGDDIKVLNKVIKQGEFSNIKNNPILQSIYFTPVTTRYLQLKATRMINGEGRMGFAEIFVQ